MLGHNKRYILWFYVLNLTLAEFGTSAFRKSAHGVLDHSLLGNRLVNGFDIPVMAELFGRPEFGRFASMTTPALYFAFLFFAATALFLPGVFKGFASTYRLPREDFFSACGRNLWRFIRLMFISGILMGVVAGVLFGINDALGKRVEESTNELLPFKIQMLGVVVVFLVMTTLRIWFDLAEVDIVLSDQRAVRKSIALAFRYTFRGLSRLLTSYVVSTIVAAIILLGGLWTWMKVVAPESVLGAFLVSQFTLLLLLIPRFWQRGVAVSFWQLKMMAPVVASQPFVPQPVPVAVTGEPEPSSVPATTHTPQEP